MDLQTRLVYADIWLDCHVRKSHTPRVIDGQLRCKFCGADCGW